MDGFVIGGGKLNNKQLGLFYKFSLNARFGLGTTQPKQPNLTQSPLHEIVRNEKNISQKMEMTLKEIK